MIINGENSRIWKNAIVVCPGVHLEGLRKTTKQLSQGSWAPGRNSKTGCLECEAGGLTTQLRCSIQEYVSYKSCDGIG